MDNKDYIYFFYGIDLNDKSQIYDIFSNGLISDKGTDINSVLSENDVSNSQFNIKAKEYSKEHGNAVFVVRIPKYCLAPRVENGRIQQMPLPIWKPIDEEKYEIPSSLVYGVYLDKNESFVFNTTYSPAYDPTGLQYDDRQIKYLEEKGITDTYEFAKRRKGKSFEELTEIDNNEKNWDNFMTKYRNHFGI